MRPSIARWTAIDAAGFELSLKLPDGRGGVCTTTTKMATFFAFYADAVQLRCAASTGHVTIAMAQDGEARALAKSLTNAVFDQRAFARVGDLSAFALREPLRGYTVLGT